MVRKNAPKKAPTKENSESSFTALLKRLLAENRIFFGILALFSIYYIYLFAQLMYPPGPIYGGDVFFHFGAANHLADGGSVFESSHYQGEYNHYPYISHLTISAISLITTTSLFTASNIFTILVNLAGGIILYLIGKKLFENNTIYASSLAILGFLPMIGYAGPTAVSLKIFLPLIFLCFFYIENKKYMIPIGIAFGLAALDHVIAFLAFNLMLALYFISKLIFSDKKRIFERIKDALTITIPVFLISFSISMLYWAPIFIRYHAKTINSWQEYGAYGIAGMFPTFFGLLKMFIGTNNYGILFPLFTLIAVMYIIKEYRKEKNIIAILFILTFIIGYLHPLITIPLLNTSFGYYGFGQLIGLIQSVLIVYGAYVLIELIKNFKKYRNYLILILAVQMVVFAVFSAQLKDTWFINAEKKNDFMDAEFRMADFVKANTGVDDVILTPHGETSFAINAITGRKIVSMRRTHASPFVDANKREADTAIMLYGKNSNTVSELLSQYDVKYLFIDSYALQQVQQCNQVWDLLNQTQYQDASYACLRTSPEYESYLNQNGIETKHVFARQDIASDTAPKSDLIAIKPDFENLSIKDRLSPFHQEVMQNQPVLIMFQIRR